MEERIIYSNSIILSGDQKEEIRGLTVEYPYVMHRTEFKDNTIPWHWHEEVEFGYVVSGEAEVITADRTYLFARNEGYFMNSNILASMRKKPETEAAVMHTHLFHPVFLGGHFRSIFETKYVDPVIHNRNLDLLELRGKNENQKKIMQMIKQADYLQRKENTEFQTRNLFSDIWLILSEEIKAQPAHAVNIKNQDRIQTMLSYIHQNYTEKISLEQIASSAAVSTRECIRCFQNTIRRSPVEYLTEYRLEAARNLLKNTDLSVTEISLRTGFSSNAYFGKLFREKYGITPLQFRTGK